MLVKRTVQPVVAIEATENNFQEVLRIFNSESSTFAYLGVATIAAAKEAAKEINPNGFVIKFHDSPVAVSYVPGNVIVHDVIPLVYSDRTEFQKEYTVINND